MRPYIRRVMREAHETGAPVMRPLFFGFPGDIDARGVEDAYLFGPDVLVAPVMEPGARTRQVYLPAGRWKLTRTGEIFDGGQTVTVEAPIEYMPVFERMAGD